MKWRGGNGGGGGGEILCVSLERKEKKVYVKASCKEVGMGKNKINGQWNLRKKDGLWGDRGCGRRVVREIHKKRCESRRGI